MAKESDPHSKNANGRTPLYEGIKFVNDTLPNRVKEALKADPEFRESLKGDTGKKGDKGPVGLKGTEEIRVKHLQQRFKGCIGDPVTNGTPSPTGSMAPACPRGKQWEIPVKTVQMLHEVCRVKQRPKGQDADPQEVAQALISNETSKNAIVTGVATNLQSDGTFRSSIKGDTGSAGPACRDCNGRDVATAPKGAQEILARQVQDVKQVKMAHKVQDVYR